MAATGRTVTHGHLIPKCSRLSVSILRARGQPLPRSISGRTQSRFTAGSNVTRASRPRSSEAGQLLLENLLAGQLQARIARRGRVARDPFESAWAESVDLLESRIDEPDVRHAVG